MKIEIVGADANNLRDVNVAFPARGVTAVTGVSGSGKSSLVDDTLAGEAERRAHVFLDVKSEHHTHDTTAAFIGPLPPPVRVGQRAFHASARTTVGTATGLLAILRRLFLEHSVPWCDAAEEAVPPPSPATYAAWLARHYAGEAEVWAIPVWYAETDGRDAVAALTAAGARYVSITTQRPNAKRNSERAPLPIAKFRPLDATARHVIEASVGKLRIGPKTETELRTLLERAWAWGKGRVVVTLPAATTPALASDAGPRLFTDEHWVHPRASTVYAPASTHLLSFNAPSHVKSGACPACLGLGRATTIDEARLVTRPDLSMHAGAFGSLWTPQGTYKHVNIRAGQIEGLRGMQGFDPDVPWRKLPATAKRLVLEGGVDVEELDPKTRKRLTTSYPFVGFRHAILRKAAGAGSARAVLADFVVDGACPTCGGTRWSQAARALRVGSVSIDALLARTMTELEAATRAGGALARALPKRASRYAQAMQHLATSLVDVGLGHLPGDRGMRDVSQGESRRLQLASVLGYPGAGLLLLLDEPARGLHEEDVARLAVAVASLGQRHAVVLSEHRRRLLEAAEREVVVGPGAGPAGGRIIHNGPPIEHKHEELLRRRDDSKPSARLVIEGATLHAMRDQKVRIPLGRVVCLTGLSGSGKSNFARGILVPGIAKQLGVSLRPDEFETRSGSWSKFTGTDGVSAIVALDHRASAVSSRSSVATLLDLAAGVRKAWARTPEAAAAGLREQDFGFNAGHGRCQLCMGAATTEEDGVDIACVACGGARLGALAGGVTVSGETLAQLFQVPIADLLAAPNERLTRVGLGEGRLTLQAVADLGVGHLSLGRTTDTLSGGELQRLRLALRLAQTGRGIVFVLDEPAAGLHHEDVEQLVRVLDRLVDGGRNTVVLIEHNIEIIRAADWVVEFGPGAGPDGGRVVADGSPEEVAKTDTATGRALKGRVRRSERVAEAATPSVGGGESHARALRAYRLLRGEDLALLEDNDAQSDELRLAADAGRALRGGRPLDVGGLDHELAQLAVAEVRASASAQREELLAAWRGDMHLAVVPLLGDIAVWEGPVPASLRELAARAAKSVGLTVDGKDSLLRATKSRWSSKLDADEKSRALDEALSVGAGYVELRRDGRTVARLAERPVDLDAFLVGPRRLSAGHLSRASRSGRCPTCQGAGAITEVELKLVVAKPSASVADESLFTKEALEAIRGVRHSEWNPLLSRLQKDGVWSGGSFAKLGERERSWFLHGCWARASHGTYLRSSSAAPDEVGAWLRWDGLFREVLAALPKARAKARGWADEVESTKKTIRCPSCEGTGTRCFGRAVQVLGRTWHEWLSRGTIRELVDALDRVALGPREKRRANRLSDCLVPLPRQTPLAEVLPAQLARNLAGDATRALTTMHLAESS